MSKENKKYFWFKLKEDFFHSKEIKIIRKMPSGADILIVLFKLQLHSLKTGGIIEIDGLCDTVEDELSILIDEDPQLIKLSLLALSKFSLINTTNESDIKMLLHEELVGQETASTIRSRKSRAKSKLENKTEKKALQCNIEATNCNTDIEKELDIEKENKEEINYSSLQEYWNSKENLTKIKSLSNKRKEKIKIRIEEIDKEQFKIAIDKINASDFCTGKNERNWKADIDWLINNDTNIIKVLEGKYDNKLTEMPTKIKPLDITKINKKSDWREKLENN